MSGDIRRLLLLLAVAVLLAGCVKPPPLDVRLAWLDATPPGVVPAALASVASGLVVAGTDATGEAPAVAMENGAPVPLVPSEPYAASARIVSAASAGGVLYLIGGRSGGAHGNTRWTVWDGTVAGPVTSRPQEFFTFGGHDAGPLLGTVIVDGHPIIVGSRGAEAGPEAALYAVDGEVWNPLDTPAALQSASGLVLGLTAVTSVGSTIVIVGDSVHSTADGVVQTPALFYGTVGGEWRRIDLPVPTDAPGLRHATAVACADGTCWVAGWATHPIVWQVSLGDGVVGSTTTFVGDATGPDDPSALITIVDGRPLVVTNAAAPSAEVLCADGWSSVPSPATATAITALGSDAYLVAGDRLWRATVPAC
jgi:hypothetical protein